MAFTRVHHVGLVVTDLEEARHVTVDGFGLSIDEHRTPWPGARREVEGVQTIQVPIGEIYYELSKPLSDESAAGRFLAANGGRSGMHYIAIASTDIARDVQGLTSKGAKLQGN